MAGPLSIVDWQCFHEGCVEEPLITLSFGSRRIGLSRLVETLQRLLAASGLGCAAMRRPSLHGAGEFVSATWEMINGNFFECGWSADGTEIVVRNPERLAENVLPRYFRHTQYSSWVRTLNHYSFRKTRPGQWVNPHFQRDKPELLHHITRKVGVFPSTPTLPYPCPCSEF